MTSSELGGAPPTSPGPAAGDAVARTRFGLGTRLGRGTRLGVGAGVVALPFVVTVLVVAFGAPRTALPGLPDAGAVTYWGLPLTRLLGNLAALGTLGWLLGAAVLVPGSDGTLRDTARRCCRRAGWAAAAWSIAAAAQLAFTTSDLSARPVVEVLDPDQLRTFVAATTQGKALVAVVVLALLVALLARLPDTTTGAGALAAIAGAGLLPPVVAGHAASSGQHATAVVALAVHVVAASAWTGGLLALLTLVRLPAAAFGAAVCRFGAIATACAVAVAASGGASAALRLGSATALFDSRYGLLVLAKTATLAGALLLAARLRRQLPGAAGAATRFVRTAAVEASVLAVTVGLAVGLARTPPPVDDAAIPADPTQAVLGYPMPDPVTAARLLTNWRPDWVFVGAVLLAAVAYLAAVRRLARRGDHWPPGRTAAWLTGLGIVAVTTSSGLARYGPVLLSVHMSQHMILSMLAPIPLVLGAPVTLALRALRPAAAPHRNGPREWLLAALHSRPARLLTHPLVVTVGFVASLYALYLSPALGLLMSSHLGHTFMNVHFLVVGFLFFELLVGVDPLPRRPPYPGRVLMLLATVPFHAVLGLTIMNTASVLGASWYDQLNRPWVDALADQHTAGGIVWAFGELPTFVVMLMLVAQWARTDDRHARQRERRVETTGVDRELDDYNAYLASLHRHRHRDRDRDRE